MEQDTTPEIALDIDGEIARLKLKRPQKANAISTGMLETIVETCARIASEGTCKALVISAAGRRFTGGVDLAMLDPAKTAPKDTERYLELWDRMIAALKDLAVPVICVVQGPAVAGGMSIAFSCDVVIASTEARFSYPRIPQGHVPGRHMLSNVVRVMGPGRARLILLGARVMDAQEAAAAGLAHLVVPHDRLEAEVDALLGKIRQTPRELLLVTHRLIDDPGNESLWAEAERL